MAAALDKMPRTTAFRLASLVVICLLPVALYIPVLNTPLFVDEGFYATVARQILHGGVPYRDAFDNKPPLIFVWYALSFQVLGEHAWAPRLLAALFLSATCGVVYAQARQSYSHYSSLFASTAFALSASLIHFEAGANTEYFMVLPMTAGLLSFTAARRRSSLPLYGLSGAMNGIAIMTRQTALFPFVFLVGYQIWIEWRGGAGSRAALQPPVLALTGAALLVAVAGMSPIILAGAGEEAFDALIVYAWQYGGDVPLYAKVINGMFALPRLILIMGPFLLLAMLGLAYWVRKENREDGVVLVGWTAANILAVLFVGRYFAHHFIQLVPALALLAPAGIRFLRPYWTNARARIAVYALFAPALIVSFNLNLPFYLESDAEARHRLVHVNNPGTVRESQSPQLGRYLRAHSSPGDSIYVLGYQPELYFYADRTPASRYMFDDLFDTDPSLINKAIDDLGNAMPLYFIDSSPYDGRGEDHDYSAFRRFISVNYDYVGMIQYADVYRLRAPQSNEPPGD